MAAVPVRRTIGRAIIFDVRHIFPPQHAGSVGRPRLMSNLLGLAVHHDGVIMAPGDRDYNGTTLNEDLERLGAIYRHGADQGWGGFPYQFVASPNGRLFYTTDVSLFGAHVARRNHELLGLALMGDFSATWPGQALLCAAGLGVVTAWHLAGRLLDVRGHREWALAGHPTVCPGDMRTGWQRDLLQMAVVQARLAFPRD